MQKAEERPQRRYCKLRHPAIQTRAPSHHEGGDIGRGQAPEVKTSGREPAVQKRAQAIEIPKGRHRDQSAFGRQKLSVPVQDFRDRAVRHGGFSHWHQPQPAQMGENGAKCLARLQLAHASGSAVSHETIDLSHGQVAHSELLDLQPADQVVEQLALLPDRAGPVSLPPQILLEPFRKDCDRVLTPSLLLIDQQISPRFDVNEKTLPALTGC